MLRRTFNPGLALTVSFFFFFQNLIIAIRAGKNESLAESLKTSITTNH